MNETKKSLIRRSFDRRFATRYLVGEGIDIGCGNDSIGLYKDLFPLMSKVDEWDLKQGDAQVMQTVPDDKYDFVHSSHCLEHMRDPFVAMKNWIRICKPSGYIILMVPDEDLYEQGVFPSKYNGDHKHTFTIGKSKSWCPNSINITNLLNIFLEEISILKIELLDMNYRYGKTGDQTLDILGESAIEIIMRKCN